jgi:hypothetical protein
MTEQSGRVYAVPCMLLALAMACPLISSWAIEDAAHESKGKIAERCEDSVEWRPQKVLPGKIDKV